jgi:predicted dehydrogenase
MSPTGIAEETVMNRTLIVGLGRSGLGLHWRVLRELREAANPIFGDKPVLAWDICDITATAEREGLVPVHSLEEARELLDPDETVVHICTPPVARLDLVRELSDLGFTRLVVEKPLATDAATAIEVDAVRRARGLQLVLVAHWLDSMLTRRLLALTRSEDLGALRAIWVAQHKPRMRRTLASDGHPTAFDVELPHSVGVALRIAGDAQLDDATVTDMVVDDTVVPRMGSARMVLAHDGDVRTEIYSDLASPVRERRIELDFTRGSAVGYFPGSEDDHYAHLRVRGDREKVSIFPDNALASFFVRVYTDFAHDRYSEEEFLLGRRVVELIDEAKDRCLAGEIAARIPTVEESTRYGS